MFDLDIKWKKKEKRILGLDVENGPKWGWGPNGYTFSAVFCIAWKWVGQDRVRHVLIDWRRSNEHIREVLAPVYDAIALADKFLGHNFQHDTGLLVGTAKDVGLPLPDVSKPLIDTMRSVPKSQGAMRSLEALCEQFNLGEKPHIPPYVWAEAWVRWDPEALYKVVERCTADVRLTEKLYDKERELGWLP